MNFIWSLEEKGIQDIERLMHAFSDFHHVCDTRSKEAVNIKHTDPDASDSGS